MDGTTTWEMRAAAKVTELSLSRHRGDGTAVVLVEQEKPKLLIFSHHGCIQEIPLVM